MNGDRDASDRRETIDIVAEALERVAEGRPLELESLCGGDPNLIRTVRESLDLVPDVPELEREAAAEDPLSGTVLGGRYILQSCLGAGAMGVVYAARDLDLPREVAVKIVRSGLRRSEAEARFAREGEALAAVRHPAVVHVFDRGTTLEGDPFLVMELIHGQPLSSMTDAPVDVRTAASWAATIADGLTAAHRTGVFHRDVKPSNILLRDGEPVLIDFGIAALADHATLAAGSRGVGTPAYMAPEQLERGTKPSPAMDVYSLTATLYHLLAGRPPYEGTPSQVVASIQRDDPTPISKLRPGLPCDLQAIIDKGLHRDSKQRYHDAEALSADLRAFLQHEPVRARYIGPMRRQVRRVLRSPVVRALTAVAIIVAVVSTVAAIRSEYVEAHNRLRQTKWAAAFRQFEPALTLWNPLDRYIADPEHRKAVFELVDEAARWSDDPIPTFVIRAALRFDHNDTEGAAADMDVVFRRTGAPSASVVAQLYRESARESAETPSMTGIEPARTTQDLFLVTFHALRAGEYGRARALLADPLLVDFPPAAEYAAMLRIPSISREREPATKLERARRLYERAIRIEEARGFRTATTAHIAGAALLEEDRFTQARRAIREGLELAPRSSNLWANLGIVERRLGNLDDAVKHLRVALKHRQSKSSAGFTLIQIHEDQLMAGDESAYERGLRSLASVPMSDQARAMRHGALELAAALNYRRNGDLEEAVRHARLAKEIWTTPNPKLQELPVSDENIRTADRLIAGETPVEALLHRLVEEPDHRGTMLLVEALLPDDFDSATSQAIKAWMRARIEQLAPAPKTTIEQAESAPSTDQQHRQDN